MSAIQFGGDVLHLNFSHAWERLKDWYSGLPAWMRAIGDKIGTQEGVVFKSLVQVGLQDVVSGGFTTVAFIKAGKDILAQLIAQEIKIFSMQDVMAALNMAVAALPADQQPVQPVVEPPAAP